MNNFFHIALKDRRKARVYTAIIMALFFLILIFIPFFSYQNPPPGQEGLLVSFGEVDAGQGNEAPPEEAPSKPEEEVKPTKPKEKPKAKPKPTKTKPKESKPKEKPKEVKTPIDEKVISARNEAIALEKQKAQEKADKKAKEDALAQAEAAKEAEEKARREEVQRAKEAKEKAEAIAAAEAAKKKKETEDFKNSLADAFKKGNGSGLGDTGKPGTQGVDDGDPNADALKGLNTGEGRIGGGLKGRGGKGPGIKDNSNKTGRVVVNVCIDQKGNVTSVKYTQKGSTTQDAELIKLALENADKWSFNQGTSDTTCGTISYDFKVK